MKYVNEVWSILDSTRGASSINSLDIIDIYDRWLSDGVFDVSNLNIRDEATKEKLIGLLKQMSNQELIDLFYIVKQNERVSDTYEFRAGDRLALAIFKRYANTKGAVLDIASGSAQFIRTLYQEEVGKSYSGEEINPHVVKMARVLTQLSGINNIELQTMDSLINWNSKKYDMVYCNMPFLGNIKRELRQNLNIKTEYNLERISISDWIFTLRVLEALKEDGVGISIVRGAALNAIRDKEIRKQLVHKKCLKAVIQLPAGLMEHIQMPTYMLVMTTEQNEKIRIIDASEEYIEGTKRNKKSLSNDNINRIVEALETHSDIRIDITEQDLEKVEYNLHPLIHLKNGENMLINPQPLSKLTSTLLRGRDINKTTLDEDKDKVPAGYLLNLSDLNDIYIDELNQPISQELVEAHSKMLVREHDLVITSRGSKIRVAIIDKSIADKQVIVSSNITIIRPDIDQIDPYYLLAYMNSETGMNMIERMNTGSVIFTFTNKKLSDYLVPVLPKEEMEMIADEMMLELADYKRMVKNVKRFKEKLPTIFNKFNKEEY
ncbi:EcoKI restriction-modification system protein HsdS [Macrococcoides caseolyticum]|uniref:N-6 DNA methylase n=1 Tax=Macrococcoides caseolyticum TaxID=69966 RepID=UPI000E07E305|nr:N-6 DNA methylase [Macrococcus caseolyticus]STY78257.1 EcoKI restriction-modification system protein HsdS [Macrococcus caseolyticus]